MHGGGDRAVSAGQLERVMPGPRIVEQGSDDRGDVGAGNRAAEADLRARDLDWTILRPGGLTDAPATGKVRLAAPPVPRGSVPRADVAAVIAALLDTPGTRHQTLELVGGDSPVAAAVHRLS